MNCMDFRRQLLIDPNHKDDEMILHERECASCSTQAQQSALFESNLKQALAVEVPQGLADRIKTHQGAVERVRVRVLRPWKYAMAASLVLMFGIIGLLSYQNITLNQSDGLLQQAVLDHIKGELHHLAEHNNVQLAELNQIMSPLGVQAVADIGPVNFAGLCNIRKHLGVHMVLAGAQGPVTVIIMSDEMIDRDARIENTRFSGVILPQKHGSVAVVGEQGESLNEIIERLQTNIIWST